MPANPLREMSVEQVASRLGRGNFFVFDNNSRGRWAAGHVPGAKHLDPAEFTAVELPADRNATLVFYCAGPG